MLHDSAQIAADGGGTLIVDEAIRLATESSALVRPGPQVTVVGGLSKMHGVAGRRLGWVIADRSRLRQMRTLQQYNSTQTTVVSLPSGPASVPTVPGGYDAVRFNAMRHGILSRYTVLAHESADDYQALLTALAEDHQPSGATQVHLVEEMASIIWRKRRVLQAEGANINQGFKGSARDAERVISAAAPFELGLSGKYTDIRDLMDLTPADVCQRQRDARSDLESTRQAAAILRRGGSKAYQNALRALQASSRDWWHDFVADEEYPDTPGGLAELIVKHLEPTCIQVEKEARHHEAIKAQALGEGLQAYRLEKLNRYETHLDRKFQRTLGMLLKLKELTRGSS